MHVLSPGPRFEANHWTMFINNPKRPLLFWDNLFFPLLQANKSELSLFWKFGSKFELHLIMPMHWDKCLVKGFVIAEEHIQHQIYLVSSLAVRKTKYHNIKMLVGLAICNTKSRIISNDNNKSQNLDCCFSLTNFQLMCRYGQSSAKLSIEFHLVISWLILG